MPAVRAPAQRFVSALVLVLWTAPGLSALGLAVHLALDHHHGPHDAGHAEEVAELARAATHGHRHDLDAGADHEHEARVESSAPAVRSVSPPVAVLPSFASAAAPPTERGVLYGASRRAPPAPLFATHCSLLL